MKITFLGTASGAPTRHRNVSAVAVQLIQQGKLWLFDCGEGTQHQFLRSPLRVSQMERIFLTHLHGDHLFGLPGLLASRSLQAGVVTPVTIYGPSGIAEYLRCVLDRTQTRPGYPIHIETLKPGLVCSDPPFRVTCAPLLHRIETFGFAIEEETQIGRFDAERAAALGVPPGPLYGKLKNGETITLSDGSAVRGQDLVGPARPGRKVVYSGDTIYTPRTVELARQADVLIHEATYAHADADLAERGAHSTATDAARVALEAGVGSLILTHISARYEAEGRPSLEDLLAEARAVFPNTFLAYDFWSYDVPRRDPTEDRTTPGVDG